MTLRIADWIMDHPQVLIYLLVTAGILGVVAAVLKSAGGIIAAIEKLRQRRQRDRDRRRLGKYLK